MKLCLKNSDSIHIEGNNINVILDKQKYVYSKTDIEAAMLITNNLGPYYDDLCLAIRIDKDTAIFIMSEHSLFKGFLFDELSTIINIDYDAVIKATTCVENDIFFIYQRS